MRSILTFRAASIGDSLMGKYLLENIRAAYPEVRCELVVSSRAAMVRDLFAAYPWIRVVEATKRPEALWKLFSGGRRDVAVTPYTGGVFGMLPKLAARAAGRMLVGYTDRSPFNTILYDRLIPLIGRSRAPRLLETDALAAMRIPATIEHPQFVYLPQPDLLPRLGLEHKKYVVLHLFSGGRARSLSPERKRVLIDAVRAVTSLPLILTGSPTETASVGALPSGVHAVETSLQELAALIDASALMVSLDTGAAHLAAHMRHPLVVLASCVGVQWWSPDMYGAGVPSQLFTRLDVCVGGHDYSGYAPCLDAIDMHEVAARARELLS